MKLVDSVLSSFCVVKVFRDNSDQVNRIDFAPNGETLVTSGNDDSIVIYDCAHEGKPKRTLYSKKYGVVNIQFTHAGDTVIYGSNKVDDAIRYQSLDDNRYIRYYAGHKHLVTCLQMSPKNDTFLSASLDKTIRFWDLRSPNCQGLVNTSHSPIAAFDPEGLIFATGNNSEIIQLYDLRSFDKGPFITFRLQRDPSHEWTELKFSPDGKTILISTNGSDLKLIDAFHGQPLHCFSGYLNSKKLWLEACFTPDAQFVLSGSQDGRIHVYKAESGVKVAELEGKLDAPVTRLGFNSKLMMFASASSNMAFWLPTMEE